jgi:hypothetical protein
LFCVKHFPEQNCSRLTIIWHPDKGKLYLRLL